MYDSVAFWMITASVLFASISKDSKLITTVGVWVLVCILAVLVRIVKVIAPLS